MGTAALQGGAHPSSWLPLHAHITPPAPGYEPLAPLPPAASAVPVWQDRTIASTKLRLLEYSAFMEVPRDAETVTVPSACPPPAWDGARPSLYLVASCSCLTSPAAVPTPLPTVQQTPLRAHRPDEPLVQRPAAGGRGHPPDLRQVS